jgi:hypothetical protein
VRVDGVCAPWAAVAGAESKAEHVAEAGSCTQRGSPISPTDMFDNILAAALVVVEEAFVFTFRLLALLLYFADAVEFSADPAPVPAAFTGTV